MTLQIKKRCVTLHPDKKNPGFYTTLLCVGTSLPKVKKVKNSF